MMAAEESPTPRPPAWDEAGTEVEPLVFPERLGGQEGSETGMAWIGWVLNDRRFSLNDHNGECRDCCH